MGKKKTRERRRITVHSSIYGADLRIWCHRIRVSSYGAYMNKSPRKRRRWTVFWGDENERSTIVCVEIRMAWMWKVSGGFSFTYITAKKGKSRKNTWEASWRGWLYVRVHLNSCEVKWELWWCSGEVTNPPLVSVCSHGFFFIGL